MKKLFSTTALCVFYFLSFSQNGVSINNTGNLPAASAMLDISNPNKGLLVPRVSLTSINDVTTVVAPATSLLVFNTNASIVSGDGVGYYYFNGFVWVKLIDAMPITNNAWKTTGNAGTTPSINFIGTTDDNDLVFKRYNLQAGYLGVNNLSLGLGALNSLNYGLHNLAIGNSALSLNTSGYNNISIGDSALGRNLEGASNISIGVKALIKNTTGYNNIAIGESVLIKNQSGSRNLSVGLSALENNTTGNDNIGLGINALRENTTGEGNVGIGRESAGATTTGFGNTAIGSGTLTFNTTGSYNCSMGVGSLVSNISGSSNVGVGLNALAGNITGENNVGIGTNTLRFCDNGNKNIALGALALDNLTNGSNNIGIGFEAYVPDNLGSNQIRLGNADITYAGTQVAWSITSDKRWKTGIKSSNLGLDFIKQLNPVSYTRNNDNSKKTEYGFIAQELEKTLIENGAANNGIISKNDAGMLSVRYNDLLAPMVKAMQEQQKLIEKLQTQVEQLTKQLNK
jgi:trimeric autotransporter adhesin